MPDIKPIETIYNGYRFRSRLEARWAVFFDAIGFDYEYEPEGFNLGNNCFYLPDFYLPENDSWVEIKGKDIDETTYRKLIKFCSAKCDLANGGSKFRILIGKIQNEIGEGIKCFNYISKEEYRYMNKSNKINYIEDGLFLEGLWIPNRTTEQINYGLSKARMARFEYGECG